MVGRFADGCSFYMMGRYSQFASGQFVLGQTEFRKSGNENMSISKCILENNIEKAIILLGADPSLAHEETIDGTDVLCFAASVGATRFIKLFLEYGANPNRPNKIRRTALMGASRRGKLEGVKLLIEAGASLDAANDHGRTALDKALKHRNKEVADYLISLGAKTGTSRTIGASGASGASGTGGFIRLASSKSKSEKLLASIGIPSFIGGHVSCKYFPETLRDSYLNCGKCDNENMSIFECIKRNDIEGVTTLLKANPSIANEKSYDGSTALFRAVVEGEIRFIKLLLEYGSDVNVAEKSGVSPLMSASSMGNLDIVKLLVKAGASLNIEDICGRTAFDWALDRAGKDVINYLSNLGAKEGSHVISGSGGYVRLATSRSRSEKLFGY